MSSSPRSPIFCAGDVRHLAMLAAVANALLLAALLYNLRSFVMRRPALAVAMVASASLIMLAGCASTGSAELAKQALGNLEHCERTYIAAVGAMGVPGGSLSIRCPAKPFEAPVQP